MSRTSHAAHATHATHATQSTHAIRADGLHKTYGKGESEVRALRDVSVHVERGEVVALLGPSGSGKSTLLMSLGLLLLPERGVISLAGDEIVVEGVARRELASLRRSRLGFVFQKSNLVPFLTAQENVLLALEINEVRGKAAVRAAQGLLDYLGLAGRFDAYPDELSGGQAQRVAIARALAMDPPVILADEPTAALDGKRGRDVMELFRRVSHEKGAAVVVVTHDHRTLDTFDTVYEMEDGVLSRYAPNAPNAPVMHTGTHA